MCLIKHIREFTVYPGIVAIFAIGTIQPLSCDDSQEYTVVFLFVRSATTTLLLFTEII